MLFASMHAICLYACYLRDESAHHEGKEGGGVAQGKGYMHLDLEVTEHAPFLHLNPEACPP
jgi:hypothetical protein